MTIATKSDLSRIAVSAIGALAVSATCILAAVGPAKAEAPASVPAWTAQVAHRIARTTPDMPDRFVPGSAAPATVAVHFGADGDFAGATLVGSTGDRLVDRRVVRLARTLRYPRLPEAARGQPQDVTLVLTFGPADGRDAPVRMAVTRAAGSQLASR